jgi:hypothetical protein
MQTQRQIAATAVVMAGPAAAGAALAVAVAGSESCSCKTALLEQDQYHPILITKLFYNTLQLPQINFHVLFAIIFSP